jgi:hypothetical protein
MTGIGFRKWETVRRLEGMCAGLHPERGYLMAQPAAYEIPHAALILRVYN